MNAFEHSQQMITGSVDVDLYKGNIIIRPLYSADLASMVQEGGDASVDYFPADAVGSIRINGTRLKAYQVMKKSTKVRPRRQLVINQHDGTSFDMTVVGID